MFQAWSSVLYKLIPNVQELEKSLKLFADVMECNEIVLFDLATVFMLVRHVRVPHNDINRFQKILINLKKIREKYKLVSYNNKQQ